MRLFGYEILKAEKGDAFNIKGEHSPSEIVEAIKSFDWVRNTLITQHDCAPPQVDPFLLSTLFDCNGYHSNAIYWKQASTVGQGYDCSNALRAHIEEANEDDSRRLPVPLPSPSIVGTVRQEFAERVGHAEESAETFAHVPPQREE